MVAESGCVNTDISDTVDAPVYWRESAPCTTWTVWLHYSEHMATLTCSNCLNLERYTLCYYFIYLLFYLFLFIKWSLRAVASIQTVKSVVIDYTLTTDNS